VSSRRQLVRISVGGLVIAVAALLAHRLMEGAGHRPPPVILLVSIDTLRADALSSYGNTRPNTPHLDDLTADGVRFSHAFAESPWTIPSHASLLTSLYPSVSQATASRGLPEAAVTLAELLRDAGYQTGAIVNTPYLGRKFGFDQGFDDFEEPLLHKGAPQAVDAALAYLRKHAGRPVFLFLHLFDVHGPYDSAASNGQATVTERPQPDAELRYLEAIRYHDYLLLHRFRSVAELRDAYEAGVRRVDAELGRLFAELRRDGVYDDSLIIVTSDHGEAFFEHQIWVGHGLFLYDNELHIPMILKLPAGDGAKGTVVDTPVGLIDVMPTILEVVGHLTAPSAQGQSLLTYVDAPVAERNVLGYSTNTGYTESVRSQRWKYIGPMQDEVSTVVDVHLRPEATVAAQLSRRIVTGAQLYELSIDPGETTDVVAEHPDVVAAMEQLLAQAQQSNTLHKARHIAGERPRKVDLTIGERERLRQLGYEP
jgi:arylsulfatase A-like enzyme